jgi:hypothetical protein
MMELAETYAVLGIFAIGTKPEHVEHLLAALRDISKDHYHPDITYPDHHFDNSFPFMLLRPRVAFHAPGKVVPVEECDGAISKEQVMMYPPGIPLIVPGEVWTKELVERVKHYQDIGIKLLSGYENQYEVVDTTKLESFPALREAASGLLRKPQDPPNRRWLSPSFRRFGPRSDCHAHAVPSGYLARESGAGSRSFHQRHQGDCSA